MSVLNRAKAHFSGLKQAHVDVPEWGEPEKPLRIHYGPWTIAQRKKVFERDSRGLEPDMGTVAVRTLIEKAVDEKGQKLFSEMEEHDLTYKVDALVVARIGGTILGGLPKDEDGADEAVTSAKNG